MTTAQRRPACHWRPRRRRDSAHEHPWNTRNISPPLHFFYAVATMAGGDRSSASGDRRRQTCWTDSIHVTTLSRLGQIPRPKPAETNLPAAAHGGEEAFGADPSRSRTTESCKILNNTRGTRNTILFAPQRTQRPSSPERCGGGARSERSSGKKK